mgnify:CR=1 FL=1
MKLFTTRQIAGIDEYTIVHEPIKDIDLMERASLRIFRSVEADIPGNIQLVFLAGPGNNGGDALALARMFAARGNDCAVYRLDTGKPLSGSPAINWQRLTGQGKALLKIISSEADFPELDKRGIVFDGLFGTGLARPLSGLAASLVRHVNGSGCRVLAIDIPSGLMGEDNTGNNPENVIRATRTLTLQFPKLSLLFPENESFTGEVEVVDIALHLQAIEDTPTPYYIVQGSQIADFLPSRKHFSHKGSFGHALLIAGGHGKNGAAVLSAGGCLRSGAGLVTAHVTGECYPVMQTALPEVMCSVDPSMSCFSQVPPLEKFTAAGIGPGLGSDPETRSAFRELLKQIRIPLVVDADALNMIAEDPSQLKTLPPNTILTPHPGEFRRLFGNTENSWQRLQLQRRVAQQYNIIILLKGAWSTTALPTGEVFFNPTGNPGMATGGSGDVLTGIILGLLAQGVEPSRAAIAGAYLHGLAADIAVSASSMPSMIASDITRHMGAAFRQIYNSGQ